MVKKYSNRPLEVIDKQIINATIALYRFFTVLAYCKMSYFPACAVIENSYYCTITNTSLMQ